MVSGGSRVLRDMDKRFGQKPIAYQVLPSQAASAWCAAAVLMLGLFHLVGQLRGPGYRNARPGFRVTTLGGN